MKKIRSLALWVMTLLIMGLLFSCKFTMNTEQREVYNKFITELLGICATEDVKVDAVSRGLSKANEKAKLLKFKIVDKKPETEVKKGTTREVLEKRFVTDKL